jgi:hypothetical protein
MTTPIKMLSTKNSLKEAIRLFNTHHIHGAPVMDGGFLRGIVTMSDILHAIEQDLPLETHVCEVMTEDVIYADGSVQLYEVIRKFKERSIGRLIVFEENKPVGILTQSDIFHTLPTN